MQYADVRPMIMLHDALRRELRLLPDLVRSVPEADPERGLIISEHITFVSSILYAHHHGEDVVLWPILFERAPEQIAASVHLMQDHHARIEELGTQIAAALPLWRGRTDPADGKHLADLFDSLVDVLDEHLDGEEELILPVVAQHVTMAEWNQMGKTAGTSVDPALVPVAIGMLMYEGDPQVVDMDMSRMPPDVRETMKSVARQAYEAHCHRVHGALPARTAR